MQLNEHSSSSPTLYEITIDQGIKTAKPNKSSLSIKTHRNHVNEKRIETERKKKNSKKKKETNPQKSMTKMLFIHSLNLHDEKIVNK